VSSSDPKLTTIRTTDQNDESLRKWKESLGLGTGKDISDPNDPRKCIVLSLGLEVEGRPDIIIDLKDQKVLDTLEKQPFSIKEGAVFRMKVTFKVQHQILSGMKYVQVVSRGPIRNKHQEMIVGGACGYGCGLHAEVVNRARMVPAPRRSRSTRRSVRLLLLYCRLLR